MPPSVISEPGGPIYGVNVIETASAKKSKRQTRIFYSGVLIFKTSWLQCLKGGKPCCFSGAPASQASTTQVSLFGFDPGIDKYSRPKKCGLNYFFQTSTGNR